MFALLGGGRDSFVMRANVAVALAPGILFIVWVVAIARVETTVCSGTHAASPSETRPR
jgi:hypothetical protein